MSKIMLLSMLMISAGSLAFLATPTASALWCGPSLDPNTAIVQQTCDEALQTASNTLGPYLDRADAALACAYPTPADDVVGCVLA